MSQWYYTDYRNQQWGPVDSQALLELNRAGFITGENLVWQEGSEQWRKLKDAAVDLYGKNEDGSLPELATCAFSGKVLPLAELVTYGRTFVAVDCKENFLQNLMETGYKPLQLSEDETNRGRYVGFWMRALGCLLDEVIKLAIFIVLTMACLFAASFFFEGLTNLGSAADSGNVMLPVILAIFVAVSGLLSNAVYEIWMVGSPLQGTLGKVAIGARITNSEGKPISYKRSFGRWLAKSPIFLEIVKWLPLLMFYVFIGIIFGGMQSKNAGLIVASWLLAFVLPTAVSLAVTSVFWMAAFDPEKRALHDRIASTRVIPR